MRNFCMCCAQRVSSFNLANGKPSSSLHEGGRVKLNSFIHKASFRAEKEDFSYLRNVHHFTV